MVLSSEERISTRFVWAKLGVLQSLAVYMWPCKPFTLPNIVGPLPRDNNSCNLGPELVLEDGFAN